MTDYRVETERLIKFAQDSGSESAATAAVATATLYLAEQQRIGNIISRLGVLTHLNADEQLNAEGVDLVNRLSSQLVEVGLS